MKPLYLAITSGDRDGVGLEVTCKALSKLGAQKSTRFMIACSDDAAATRELKKLHGFNVVHLSSREAPLDVASMILSDLLPNEILVWRDHGNEAAWVETCARLALNGKIDGLVTGPVSKGRFRRVNSKYMGHTGMLSALAKTPVQQGYVGDKLAVVLATDHIPVANVERALTKTIVDRAVMNASALLPLIPAKRRRHPITVLGLNPHAGEDGLIGKFERRLKLARGLRGPIPPDTAFTPVALAKSSVIVALYHDQGLIPFKMLHGQDSGFQISLGLPFVRTSVDHGTARDIFGQGKANPGSMIDALRGAITLASKKQSK